MKEIDDDVPPFGIIDDGMDYHAPKADSYDPYSMDWTTYETGNEPGNW